ncbi:MAG: OB-fold nucleic acid binding domain-containing protein [archaeon]
MNDKTLLKLAIICSIIGIFGLFVLSETTGAKIINISEINLSFIDKTIQVKGVITEVKLSQELTILEVEDETGKIKALAFEHLQVSKGSKVNIEGTIQEYENEIEIIIEKLNV